MMRDVVLHGALADQFGERFRFDVSTVRQAARGLLQLKGFSEAFAPGHYRVLVGNAKQAFALDEDTIRAANLGKMLEIHFVPVLAGAGGTPSRGASTGKVIAGAAIIGIALTAAALTPGGFALDATLLGTQITTGQIAAVGLAVALMGVAGLLTKTPGASSESFIFSGQDNVMTQGGPVPIVIGTFLTGGVIIAAGLQAYDTMSVAFVDGKFIGITTGSALPFDPAVSPNQSYYSSEA